MAPNNRRARPRISDHDPKAAITYTYLGALGIVVSVEIVAQWLNLIPVIAIELGSALAMVVVGCTENHRAQAIQSATSGSAWPHGAQGCCGKGHSEPSQEP